MSLLERNSILLIMVYEILKYFRGNISQGLKESSLCRLYFCCRFQKSIFDLRRPYFFIEWMIILSAESFEPAKEFLRNRGLFSNVETVANLPEERVFEDSYNNGILYECDLLNVNSYLEYIEYLPLIFRTASIRGQLFNSRGKQCAENDMPTTTADRYGSPEITRFNLDENADIRRFTFQKLHYSSWFQFRNYHPDIKNSSEEDDDRNSLQNYDDCCVGQFNFFSRIYCPIEPIVHNLPIGCATTRKSKWVKVKLSAEDNYESNMMSLEVKMKFQPNILRHYQTICPILFVALSDVFSNPLAVIPSTSNYLTIAESDTFPPA
jgi:hypothetical protein